MKLRLHGNAIRIRLNRSEAAQLERVGRVENSVDFGDGAILSYAVQTIGDLPLPRAQFAGSTICIELPEEASRKWALTNQVAISGEQILPHGEALSILVEKDFQCLHGPTANDPEAFPNPLVET